jgi:hypothetical protein
VPADLNLTVLVMAATAFTKIGTLPVAGLDGTLKVTVEEVVFPEVDPA